MDTLLRNTTVRFSRRRSGHGLYEALDQSQATIGENDNYGKINTSRRKVVGYQDDNKENGNISVSYKRQRAKKRLIFLQGYKLGTTDSGKLLKSRKLKKVAIKVRSFAVSFVSFMRFNSLRSSSCTSGLAISNVISPKRIPGFC